MENILIDGRYRLLAAIGGGGEARVYSARDETSGGNLAVRLARHSTAPVSYPQPDTWHEGWVQYFGTGSDPHYGVYQVYELLNGETLAQLIPARRLDNNDWLEFVDQSLAAVEAIHQAGYVHGDLHAANFFQTATGWKLLELPFLRLDPPTGRSAVFGSIHTLAPEQIDGTPANVQTDIFALGCLYYYAASGAYPHPGTTSAVVAIHCLRFPADPLAQHAPDLPATWSDWVMDLLARNPRDRVASIAAARQLLGVA